MPPGTRQSILYIDGVVSSCMQKAKRKLTRRVGKPAYKARPEIVPDEVRVLIDLNKWTNHLLHTVNRAQSLGVTQMVLSGRKMKKEPGKKYGLYDIDVVNPMYVKVKPLVAAS